MEKFSLLVLLAFFMNQSFWPEKRYSNTIPTPISNSNQKIQTVFIRSLPTPSWCWRDAGVVLHYPLETSSSLCSKTQWIIVFFKHSFAYRYQTTDVDALLRSWAQQKHWRVAEVSVCGVVITLLLRTKYWSCMQEWAWDTCPH